MGTYSTESDGNGNEVVVYRREDGSSLWIPKDESNSDYQAYLRWLENPDAEESGTL